MAWQKTFTCRQCGYQAVVYEGKGFMGQHITMISCSDCHTIQPLVVGGVIGDIAPSYRSEAGRLCLQCGSGNIKRWDGITCPQCDGEMVEEYEKTFWC